MVSVIALILALFSQDPERYDPPWDHIEIGNWTFLAITADERAIMFVRPAAQRGRIWARYEYRADQDQPWRSNRTLIEGDCAQGRTRVLQGTVHSENNLQGESMPTSASDWSYAAPDTLAELQLEAICGE